MAGKEGTGGKVTLNLNTIQMSWSSAWMTRSDEYHEVKNSRRQRTWDGYLRLSEQATTRDSQAKIIRDKSRGGNPTASCLRGLSRRILRGISVGACLLASEGMHRIYE